MTALYLIALLVSLAGVVAVDLRHRLFLGSSPGRAAIVLAVGLAFFLIWDVAGILFGVFARGDSAFMTGIELAPHMPIEEPIFLLFLCEVTMVLVTGLHRVLTRADLTRRDGQR